MWECTSTTGRKFHKVEAGPGFGAFVSDAVIDPKQRRRGVRDTVGYSICSSSYAYHSSKDPQVTPVAREANNGWGDGPTFGYRSTVKYDIPGKMIMYWYCF